MSGESETPLAARRLARALEQRAGQAAQAAAGLLRRGVAIDPALADAITRVLDEQETPQRATRPHTPDGPTRTGA